MVTKTGELSIEAKALRLITKAHRPLPEKWHGLQDVELRYRQRYVDLVANTEVADVFRARALLIRSLRRFLDDQGFLEVDTPSLVTLVGGAAESGSAIAMARKNKLDLTIGIAMGSSIQIALFVAPALVLASGFIAPQPLELSFTRAEIGTLFLGVLIGAIVNGDGRANWYKGVQLMLVYAMIALLFYFLPVA